MAQRRASSTMIRSAIYSRLRKNSRFLVRQSDSIFCLTPSSFFSFSPA